MWLHSDCDPKHLMSVFAKKKFEWLKIDPTWEFQTISSILIDQSNILTIFVTQQPHGSTLWQILYIRKLLWWLHMYRTHYTYTIQYWLNADLQKFLLAQKYVTLAHSCTHSRLPFNLVIRRCLSACAGTAVGCAPLWFALLGLKWMHLLNADTSSSHNIRTLDGML